MNPKPVDAARPVTAKQNPLLLLGEQGQSVWLDFIRRSILDSGELKKYVDQDGLCGVTSNPAIFEKAIAGSSDYAADLSAERARCATDPKAVFEKLAIQDIQRAADVFGPVYERTKHRDGYVSLEVSPHLARDTSGTIAEARRLWAAVKRDNVMIKVPGTVEGVPAIRQLIADGINVNVTLLFAVEAYQQVAEAYQQGLEALAARGGDLTRVASVASFFVSRIDSLIDPLLEQRAKEAKTPADRALAESLIGKVAIANAKIAYEWYLQMIASPRWRALEKKGAMRQRLLWASTSTKNPRYRDVIYVEELIGRDTVNTLPPQTFDGFRDHGVVRPTLEAGLPLAHEMMASLGRVQVSMTQATSKLLDDGIKLFADAFDKLLDAVRAQAGSPARLSARLPQSLEQAVAAQAARWQNEGFTRRLWDRDATLWTGADEAQWLDWLDIVAAELRDPTRFALFAREVRAAGFRHVLLLGMGGSSLAAEVLASTFGKVAGAPELLVLDSTDPAQVRSFERRIDITRTLFVVASKSGSTLEPNIFKQYFLARVRETNPKPGSQFVAITDPGSQMQRVAEQDGFWRIFFGVPGIGGRYSALSDFGMVPAAAMGLDVKQLLGRANTMVAACGPSVPAADHPGVMLGAILGSAALAGRDKVTIVTSKRVRRLGAWLEQLLAESTGKDGKGLIPVDLEPLAAPPAYGNDRLFVSVAVQGDEDPVAERSLTTLADQGQPVVRIVLGDVLDLAGELFRWEIATAVAGAILKIHPFNQPDVEASKVATRKLTSAFETAGALPPENPIATDRGVRVFADEANARVLGADRSLAGCLRAHWRRVRPSDYIAILAYLEMSAANEALLQEIRVMLRDATRVATCLGFGPRFLHSTGQAYKGGPNSGVFLQITCDDAHDLPVPAQRYSFGVVKAAQARGDLSVLNERQRRALRLHLGSDVGAGLLVVRDALREALRS
ncbi:MAG: bifunctional transaldolase/phosoglucose isomerase [Planctomycetota bacterium]